MLKDYCNNAAVSVLNRRDLPAAFHWHVPPITEGSWHAICNTRASRVKGSFDGRQLEGRIHVLYSVLDIQVSVTPPRLRWSLGLGIKVRQVVGQKTSFKCRDFVSVQGCCMSAVYTPVATPVSLLCVWVRVCSLALSKGSALASGWRCRGETLSDHLLCVYWKGLDL